MLNTLATRLLRREWRGEWLITFFALFLAVAALTTLHFYTDRLARGLEQQGARFLGGDLVVSSPTAIPTAWFAKAKELQLQSAEVLSFLSVISSNKQLQLVNIQAVSDSYPLVDHHLQHPAAGNVWLEPRLLSLLNIQLNNVITIGQKSFRATKLLTPDIDALSTGWMIAPRVMIPLADVAATKIILPGSRVDYRLLLAGSPKQLEQFRRWIIPQLANSQRLLDTHNQQFALRSILERTENYLQLVLLVCLLMSGIAIALSVKQYVRRHYCHVALWRCLGARTRQIQLIFFWQLVIIAVAAGALGIIVGYITQTIIATVFQDVLKFALPPASWSGVLLGFSVSIGLLFAFAYPLLSHLPKTSPLFLWRSETAPPLTSQLYFIIGFFLILLFIYWFNDFSLLSLFFLNMLVVSIGVLYVVSIFLLRFLNKIVNYTRGPLRRGLSQLIQYPESVSLQFIGFTLILMSLLILAGIRTHLIHNWQQTLPKNSPNYFAFNIAPEDIAEINNLFRHYQAKVETFYPMVRGRLISLNGKPILNAIPPAARDNNALHRELNLSWMWQYPSDNKIVSGYEWQPTDQGKALASVEKNLADDLHLKLGDNLTFQIADRTITAKIVNFRTLEWSSFHPNFFVIFPPGLFTGLPTTFITSFYLPATKTDLATELVKHFPNVTLIDIASLLTEVQELLDKIILAVEYLFLFVVGLGIVIFIASLQSGMDERDETYRLLRTLGASKSYIRKSLIVEFSVLGILVLTIAVILAKIITHLLEKNIFNI